MGVLSNLYRGRYAEFGGSEPDSDEPGLWTDVWDAPHAWAQGFLDTGIPITPEIAMTVSAVWAGVTFMARNIASQDLRVIRQLDERSTERLLGHPLQRVVGRQPNPDHTALEFWEMQIGHVLLRGNAYSKIIEGSRSFADRLDPLHPDRVRPERLPSGRIVYRLFEPDGRFDVLTQDEVFHLRGFMSDGLAGMSLAAVAARSLGASVAADTYAARFFKSGASASLVAQVQDQFEDDESERELHESISRYLGGLRNVGGVLVVDSGTKVDKIGINPEEAQVLSTREHGVREVARWLGIPTQVLADAGKEPTHASAEVFSSDLVKFSFRPFGRRIEQAVDKDLLVEEDVFVRYSFDDILRGDLKARSQFYQLAVFTGWMNRAEVREREGMNPGPDDLDEFLQPKNMGMAGEVDDEGGNGGENVTTARALPGERREALRARHGVRETVFALELSARVVRRELTAITKASKKYAADGAGWQTWLREFYEGHTDMIAETLKISKTRAREYAAKNGLALEQHGVAVIDDWKHTLPSRLAELALTEGENPSCSN